ncbi:semaphorin-4G [Scyliorhinus canicula]|uniref:semaphorin-4G n=1 Tax=Scyliorhinus canicula TaxID=7830 RepID=UPI0018F7A680|nr:semaphorin-4G [Scyliorhinus canicula]
MQKMSGCGRQVQLFIPLILGVTLCSVTHAVDLDNIPRRTVPIHDLIDHKQFSHTVYNYTTFWLEEKLGLLYVGARGAIFALNISNINDSSTRVIHWKVSSEERIGCLEKRGYTEIDCFNYIRLLKRFNETHLFTCGTHAFHPHCAYIEIENFTLSAAFEGKEKCPYDPTVGYTGLIVDGKIYTATLYGFHGALADIKRNFQKRSLRMDDSLPYSLNDVTFVDSFLVPESVNSSEGDDDKIYVFFTEKLSEENAFNGRPLVTRVARVCKNDEGGMRTLQRKWTSFLKTRVVCSIPEFGFYFNILKSTYILKQGDWPNTIFYGVFVSQWQNVQTSAVCRYSLADIRKTFEGRYKEDQESARWWSAYMGKVPEPRPGSCITDKFRSKGIETSHDLPDTVLDFVKKHPLMDEEVKPMGGHPVFMKKNVKYTKIVVDTVTALDDKQYDVMFIGTDDGWLHKVVNTGSHIQVIEEIQLYEEPQSVESLLLVTTQGMLYVGSQTGMIQLPVASCRKYSTCFDCILARDPYCGWDGRVCREIQMEQHRAQLIQDIATGSKGCVDRRGDVLLEVKSRTVQKGTDIFLQCPLSSNTAIAKWKINDSELLGKCYSLKDGSLVIKDVQVNDDGEYRCFAEENGVRFVVASYNISVLESLAVSPPFPPTSPQRLISKAQEFIYLIIIAILAAVSFVLFTLSIYLFCSPSKRGNYNMRLPRSSLVELQNISATCVGKGEEGEAGRYGGDRFLKIIPGEGVPTGNHRTPSTELLPPPPPPPPLPLPSDSSSCISEPANATTPNGLPGLPHVLRKMNGNSYVLLRQASEVEATLPHYHSFTEELSKMLEKRKHAQLVEKPDESSV